MFNGIVTQTGKIHRIHKIKKNCILEIISNMHFNKSEVGSSISCSGACLTLESYRRNIAKFYLSKETLKRTIFKSLKKNSIVNLEKSLKYGERISGHFVQGHVDTISSVNNIKLIGKSWLVTFKLNKIFRKYIVEKGSITINGVSLTISGILKDGFEVSLVPHTLKKTNLIKLKKKELVNLEFDILGKYIRNFIKKK